MGRRSEHSREELQQLIIQASLDLIVEQGAAKVTARQIAKAVGYTPGMLYSVFENQHEIFLHVNDLTLNSLFEECAAASQKRRSPEKSILALGFAYLNFAQTHTHQFDLLFTPGQTTAPEKLGDQLDVKINALFALIEQELHSLNPDRSSKQIKIAARALWSGVHGTAQLARAGQFYLDTKHPDRDIVESLVQGFVASWKVQT